jgi:hypothetical protein
MVALAFLLGFAGASFAVGVPFVNRWFAPEREGAALGIYGMAWPARSGRLHRAEDRQGLGPRRPVLDRRRAGRRHGGRVSWC